MMEKNEIEQYGNNQTVLRPNKNLYLLSTHVNSKTQLMAMHFVQFFIQFFNCPLISHDNLMLYGVNAVSLV